MQGIILKGVGGNYEVMEDKTGKIYTLTPRGRFRKEKISPLPGDHVEFTGDEKNMSFEKILPRKNELVRPAAANITQVFLVFAMKDPDINYDLVYSFLLMLELKDIKPVMIFNKADLSDSIKKEELENIFSNTGYDIHFISARNEESRDELLPLLQDEVTVLAGPSGAGKSTLLNTLLGEEVMETGEVSQKIGRGRHTTRHTRLIPYMGGLIADTPGFSSLEGEKMDPQDLKDYFPEFRKYEGECRYRGCSHYREPDCKVREMVGKTISESRYSFYTRTFERLKEEEKRKWD